MQIPDRLRFELRPCADAAKAWLFESAAPLWANAGRRANGMFVELLDMNGSAGDVPHRTRVQARQTYAFCELGRLGWSGDWRSCAEQAIDWLLHHGRREDGFFIHTFSPVGEPLDLRADLYDHAFLIFCLANAADALGRQDLFDIADDTIALIERHWRHPAGGFREGEIDGSPRRQNPHMHMLEASRAMWVFSGRPAWKTRIEELLSLCAQRFIEPQTGALTEYFADDWSRLAGKTGEVVEPGHCLEWAWLCEVLAQSDIGAGIVLSDRLANFARRHGIDSARGVAVNEVLLDGSIQDGAVRLWPQGERMKAALARFRRTGDPMEVKEAVAAFRGLWSHFDTALPGLWRERQDANGRWLEQPAPASSFYHIVCALSELLHTTENRSAVAGPV